MTDYFSKIRKIIDANSDDFNELVRIAELDPGSDFKNVDLSDIDFGEANLSGFNFSGSVLRNVKLGRAKLTNVILDGVDFQERFDKRRKRSNESDKIDLDDIFLPIVESVISQLEAPRIIFVHMPPGGGKSTAANQLFQAACQLIKDPSTPIFGLQAVFLFRGTKSGAGPRLSHEFMVDEICRAIMRLDFLVSSESSPVEAFFNIIEIANLGTNTTDKRDNINNFIKELKDSILILDDINILGSEDVVQYAARNRNRMIVFHSSRDEIIQWPYGPIAAMSHTLTPQAKEKIIKRILDMRRIKFSAKHINSLIEFANSRNDLRSMFLVVDRIKEIARKNPTD